MCSRKINGLGFLQDMLFLHVKWLNPHNGIRCLIHSMTFSRKSNQLHVK